MALGRSWKYSTVYGTHLLQQQMLCTCVCGRVSACLWACWREYVRGRACAGMRARRRAVCVRARVCVCVCVCVRVLCAVFHVRVRVRVRVRVCVCV